MQKKLFLLDAMALIYRAYYAMVKSPRITSKGVNTSATLGFTNTLYEVLQPEKPTHIAVAFDTGAPTLRHADFAAYKANREATPDDIINSIPYIKRVIDAFNIQMVMMDGYEADDVIGTLAKKAEIEGFQVYMMTSDKDYGQLLSDNIFMYKPAKFGQPAQVVDTAAICDKYAIERPEQLIDILGLWGDSADNIPGVPGIGEKTAMTLLHENGTLQEIYARLTFYNAGIILANIASDEKRARSKPGSNNKFLYEVDFSQSIKTVRKYLLRRPDRKTVDLIKLLMKHPHAVKEAFRSFERHLRGIGAIRFSYR